jgi:hypothetical protein
MAKQFMSRIKCRLFITNVRRYQMVVVDIGYKKLVMPKDKAMMLVECLESADVYEEKWWSDDVRKEKGMDSTYTYHVYPNEASFNMKIVSDTHYQMARLAGKPQEK